MNDMLANSGTPPPAEQWRGCWQHDLHLAVTSGPDAGWAHPLAPGGEVTVGRARTCQLSLADPGLELVHLRVAQRDGRVLSWPEQGRVRLERTSRSGRLRRRIVPRRGRLLWPGDSLLVGDSTVTLRRCPETSPTEAPPTPRARPRWLAPVLIALAVVALLALLATMVVLTVRTRTAFALLSVLGLGTSAAVMMRSRRRRAARRPRTDGAAVDVPPDPAAFAVWAAGTGLPPPAPRSATPGASPPGSEPLLVHDGGGRPLQVDAGGVAVVGGAHEGLTRWLRAQLAAEIPVVGASDRAGLPPGVRPVLPAAGRLGVSARWVREVTAVLRPATPLLLTDLLGQVTPESIAQAWTAPSPGLGVPLGTGEASWVDLVDHGPHALVAGTTGSGKSELLQAWVLALATRSAPADLGLLLVDYKGGATFTHAAGLPHCVGLLTDLDTAASARTLAALRHELRRRERVVAAAGARDRADLVARGGRMGRLVVVVDELRALIEDDEDRLADLVAVATLGRSLGVHLILATQRPSGVVSGQLRANLPLRICQRVLAAADALDVVDDSRPARFTAPGTALVLGPGASAQPCQLAWLPGPAASAVTDGVLAARTLLARRRRHDLLTPHVPWVPALPNRVSGVDAMLLLDLPAQQRHTRWSWRHGTLLVSGPPRSGRTTALRSALAQLPGPAHPQHVISPEGWGDPRRGTVLTPADPDLVTHLLQRLLAGEDPQACVVIDGIEPLVSALDEANRPGTGLELLTALTTAHREGLLALGCTTAHRWAPAAQWHLALGVRDRTTAAMLGVPPALADPGAGPGRGVLLATGRADPAQVVLPDPSASSASVTDPGGLRLRPLPTRVDVPLAATPTSASTPADVSAPAGASAPVQPAAVMLGIGGEGAEPVTLEVSPGAPVVVIGPHGSGRSSVLRLVAASLPTGRVHTFRGGSGGAAHTTGGSVPPLPDGGVLLVDDVDRLPDSDHPDVLAALAGRCVLTTTAWAWQSGYRGLVPMLREARTLITLGGFLPPEVMLPRPARMPPGRAALIVDGRAQWVQLAHVTAQPRPPPTGYRPPQRCRQPDHAAGTGAVAHTRPATAPGAAAPA